MTVATLPCATDPWYGHALLVDPTMACQPLLDSPLKNCFIGTVLAGKSVHKAAKTHSIPQTTANDLFQKYRKTVSTHRCTGSGHHVTITPQMEWAVKHHALANRCTPFASIGKMVTPQFSASSVWRILDEAGYY